MILVTGANGLVGSFICRKLLSENVPFKAMIRENSDTSWMDDIKGQLNWVAGDVMDVVTLEKNFKEVETVIHCAAIVSFNPAVRKQLMAVNVEGTTNVVNTCLKSSVTQLIHVSSVAALGKPKGIKTIDETVKWSKSSAHSNYAESKHQAELEVWRGFSEGLKTVIVNPSVILGPADWNKSSGLIFKYVQNGSLFYTPGMVNYVDVRDVANIIYLLTFSGITGERFILNAGVTTYKEMFDQIARKFEKNPPSIKVAPPLLLLAMIFEKLKSLITRNPPIITRETIALSKMEVSYDNQKVKETLNYEFRPLTDTIEWTCKELLKYYS